MTHFLGVQHAGVEPFFLFLRFNQLSPEFYVNFLTIQGEHKIISTKTITILTKICRKLSIIYREEFYKSEHFINNWKSHMY